jgi:hypothetical protein
MKRILVSTILVLAFATTSYAVPHNVAEYGQLPEKNYSPASELCWLYYYNFCSGWVYYWTGYCYGSWAPDAQNTPKIGTCFDLAGCPDNCRHLDAVVWGAKRFTPYGFADCEIFCADEHCCPVGAPIMGIYGQSVDIATPWQVFLFGNEPLCVCDPYGKFIVMITMIGGGSQISGYSDINAYNMDPNLGGSCETEWRCSGHSYCYLSLVDYCATYGMPGPMWVSGPGYGCTNFPAIPPGCHNYFYSTGFFTEWLIDAYINCLGPTATEESTWSEIKALYK